MPGVISTSIAIERGDPDERPTTSSVEGAAFLFAARLRRGHRRAPRRSSPADGHVRAASSSCARTRSPAGGSRRSSTAPSIATGSRGRPSPWTTTSGAARTAPPRPATGVAHPDAQGLRVPRRRHRGGGTRARPGARPRAGVDRRRPARPAAGGRSSPHRASIGRSTRSGPSSSRRLVTGARDALAAARDTGQTAYVTVVQNWGEPGRRPDEPPVPGPVRPAPDPASHRRGAGRRRAVRHPRGRVPVLPARARGGPAPGPARLGGRRQRRLRAVRLALPVRDLGRAAPPRRGLRPGGRPATSGRPPRPCARCSASSPAPSMVRPTTSSSIPRRCRSRSTAPITGTGRSTPACARSPGSSWEPACRSTPSRPRMPWRNCSAAPDPEGGGVGLMHARPARGGRHTGGACLVLCPASVRCPSTMLRAPTRRTEPTWPSTDPLDLRDPLGRSVEPTGAGVP